VGFCLLSTQLKLTLRGRLALTKVDGFRFATLNTSGLAGQALYSSPAGVPFPNPPSGNTYLSRFSSSFWAEQNEHSYCYYLLDRLWENSGLLPGVLTTQTVNSVPWPARDINGSSSGNGVYVALEFPTSTSSGFSVEINYTNSVGISGRIAQNITRPSSIAALKSVMLFALEAGDVGVQSVQSVSFAAGGWSGGTANLFAYRPIIITSSFSGNTVLSSEEDIFNLAAPRIFDDSVLMYLKYVITSASLSYYDQINYQFTQG